MSNQSREFARMTRDRLEDAGSELLMAKSLAELEIKDPALLAKIETAVKAAHEAAEHITERLDNFINHG